VENRANGGKTSNERMKNNWWWCARRMATKVKKSKENGHGETGQEKKTEREDTASHSWTNKRRENTNEEKEEMKQQQWDIFCPEGKDCFYPFPSRFPSFEELPMWQYSNITTKYFVVCSLFFAARAINFVFFCFAVLAPSQDAARHHRFFTQRRANS